MVDNFEFKDDYDIDDLISIVTLLRSPKGCPWDMAQTHESIKKNFIEETYEVVEAINRKSTDALREELGDVLLQIALHTEMERENGSFDFRDVCDELCKKLIVRHPHVFNDAKADNEDQALKSWDDAKLKSKGVKNQSSYMSDVPVELPALMRAQKVQSRAAKAGFDWDKAQEALEKIYEEINELRNAIAQGSRADVSDELGDVIFSCVNVARLLNLDSEECLRQATDKFIKRFKIVENLAEENNIDLKASDLKELDRLWENAKRIIADNSITEEF